MAIDNFTASVLLAQVGKVPNDTLADAYKTFAQEEGGPSQEAFDWFQENKGKTVTVNGTNHVAIVTSLNESTSGFYPGSRYPIYVTLNNGPYIGQVFEYELTQLTLVE